MIEHAHSEKHFYKPKFDPTFNWGHIGMIGSIIMAAALAYNGVASEIKASIEFRDSYRPKIDSLLTQDKLQEMVINQLATNIKDIKDAAIKNAETLQAIQITLATIKPSTSPEPRK